MKTILLSLFISSVLFSECGTSNLQLQGNTEKPTKWRLKYMLGEKIEAQTSLLILKKKSMQFIGNNGCGSILGNLKVFTEEQLQFGSIDHTRISCKDMNIPSQFEKLLQQVMYYKKESNTLFLKDKNKETLLQFISITNK